MKGRPLLYIPYDFFRKLLLLIFIPIIIVGILVIHSLANMSIDISLEDIADAYEEPS